MTDPTPEEQAEHDRRNAEAVESYKRQLAELLGDKEEHDDKQ